MVYTKFLKDNAGEKDSAKAVLEDVMDKRGYKEAHKRHKKFNLIRFDIRKIIRLHCFILLFEQSAQNVGFFWHAFKVLLPKQETATKQAICEQLLVGNACTHHKKSVQSILFLQYRNCTAVLVGYLGVGDNILE